jgi:hypothetical protein
VTAGEMYRVGEQGPELFVPDQTGRIVPNREAEQLLRGGNQQGGGDTWHVTITGVDTRDAQAIGANLQMLSLLRG